MVGVDVMQSARKAAARNLKQWREEMGWGQKALAERAGVSQGTISNLEDENAHSPKLYSLSQVCAALGVEPFAALVANSSVNHRTTALLTELVRNFMDCDEQGQTEILRSAIREARYARSSGHITADGQLPSETPTQ